MGPLLVFHILCVTSCAGRSDCKTLPGARETEAEVFTLCSPCLFLLFGLV